MYLVFTRKPGESYRRRLRSLLLHLCDVFRALINSLVCWKCLEVIDLKESREGFSSERKHKHQTQISQEWPCRKHDCTCRGILTLDLAARS